MKIKIIKEVYSQKQRRWACAQMNKPASQRPKGLSKAEAEEMCKGPMLKKEEELEELYSTSSNRGTIHPDMSGEKEFAGHKERSDHQGLQNFKDPKYIEEILDEMEYDLTKIKQKSNLSRKFWDKNRLLDRKTREKLLAIADDFIENLGLEDKVKDITMTGSLASYNWHKGSDIDLHILINYEDFEDDAELLKNYFNLARSEWNKKHKIMIRGHEVEIYIQDEDEKHYANGVYSLKDDKWLVKPSPIEAEVDVDGAIKKAEGIQQDIDLVKGLTNAKRYQEAVEMANRLKEKIKNLRSSGLEREGIFSVENIAFKLLRNANQIEKLHHYATKAYDAMMGIADLPRDLTVNLLDEEQLNEKMMLKPGPNGWDLYSKLVAEAYLAAPSFEERAVPHFEAMIPFINKMFKRIESKIDVHFVEGHPYANAKELRDDVFNNQVMKVSTSDAEHDIFDPQTNAKFRAVHDFMSHIQAIGSRGTDFSLKGEIQSYNTHLKTMPPMAWPALFTEIIGQASTYFYQGGEFGEQKIALLDGFDYENIGVVDGYDIVDKELVKKEENEEMVAEDYQTDVKKGHKKMKFRLIGLGKGKPTPGTKKPSYKRSKSAPAGYGALEEKKKD
jgi:predicted nucleotidyltransferase